MHKMSDELIKIWERLGIDPRLDRLFNQFAHEAGRIISMMQNLDKRKLQNHPLYNQMKRLADQFAVDLEALIMEFISAAYETAEVKNDRLLMKYIKAAGIAIAGKMLLKIFNRVSEDPDSVTIANILKQTRNRSAYEQFIKNQLKLSPRVWILSRQNLKQIELYTSMGLAEGRSAAAISKDLRKFLRNPDARFRRLRDPETGKLKLSAPAKAYHPGRGVYRSAYKNALRVARTETNNSYRRADLHRWRQADFITGYEVRLSASHPREDICDFMIGKYPKSFEFTGFHPNCYCFAVPILASQEQFKSYLEGSPIPKSKHVTGIPPKAFNHIRDNSDKFARYQSKPFFLTDNFTKKNGVYYPKKKLY
jgi:hypothetical protein